MTHRRLTSGGREVEWDKGQTDKCLTTTRTPRCKGQTTSGIRHTDGLGRPQAPKLVDGIRLRVGVKNFKDKLCAGVRE